MKFPKLYWKLQFMLRMKDIDIVVRWVDGNDPLWKSEKAKYSKIDSSAWTYNDHGLLRYWFRGVEKYLPWVRYVFFITYGHFPEWLNPSHPKLKLIKHRDFIPPEYLPTFSSIPIELNYHRINLLSENYINVDDDVFFLDYAKPEEYFSEEGLPKDFFWLKPITEINNHEYNHLKLNTLLLINKHFKIENIRKDLLLSDAYPKEAINDNQKYSSLKHFPGFTHLHTVIPSLKSTQKEIWETESATLHEICQHKFRSYQDVAWLERAWNLASGNFDPYYPKGHCYISMTDDNLFDKLSDPNIRVVCLNESNDAINTSRLSADIASLLEVRLPDKSTYELF